MLINNTPDVRATLRRAVELLDIADDGALLDITYDRTRVHVLQLRNAAGHTPASVLAYSCPVDPNGDGEATYEQLAATIDHAHATADYALIDLCNAISGRHMQIAEIPEIADGVAKALRARPALDGDRLLHYAAEARAQLSDLMESE